MARRKPADTVHLRLRFPEKLRRRIEAAAGKNQQSMNHEIVERLERSFGQEDMAATIEATANAVVERIVPLSRRFMDDLYSLNPAIRVGAMKGGEDAAVKLVMEQNPSIDEHVAREHVNTLIEKLGTPRPETADEKRARGVHLVLKFLERRDHTLESLIEYKPRWMRNEGEAK